jgi:carbonic anhydrase
MKAAATVSADPVAAFERVTHHANNRPVQPLNARRVLQ